MPKSHTATRQHILATATELFSREGYRAIGVDTIIEQSGVAKMTLYRHFASKNDLIVAYLENANAEFWDWFNHTTNQYPDQPRAQLIAIFAALATFVSNPSCHGCPFLHAAVEFPDPTHPSHELAIQHKQSVHARLHDLSTQAGAHEPAQLADQLLILMDGTFMQARLRGSIPNPKQVVQAATTLIYTQLIPPK